MASRLVVSQCCTRITGSLPSSTSWARLISISLPNSKVSLGSPSWESKPNPRPSTTRNEDRDEKDLLRNRIDGPGVGECCPCQRRRFQLSRKDDRAVLQSEAPGNSVSGQGRHEGGDDRCPDQRWAGEADC